MHIPFKTMKKTIISFMFIMFNIAVAMAQSFPVSVNVAVVPPYQRDAFFYYSAMKTSVIIINTGMLNEDVSLFLEFKGDNGVNLRTRESFTPFNMVLQSDTPSVTPTESDLEPYFQAGNLVATGISINELQQNGLPPGQYQICIRVRRANGEFVSGEDPFGCSNYFSINAVEPPQLINPICGDEITTGNNNIVFSWTTPPGVFPTTMEYTLKMVELLPNQDPNQAFLSSTVPAFLERSVFTQTSILYGPTDPPLEAGKSYAWQVIAKEGEPNTPILNGGKSEVCWFTWKPTTLDNITLLNIPPDKPSTTTNKPTFTPDGSVKPLHVNTFKGKIVYAFRSTESGINKLDTNTKYGAISTTQVSATPIFSTNPSVSGNTTAQGLPNALQSSGVTEVFSVNTAIAAINKSNQEKKQDKLNHYGLKCHRFLKQTESLLHS